MIYLETKPTNKFMIPKRLWLWIILALGIISLSIGFFQARYYLSSIGWDKTTGYIVESSLQSREITVGGLFLGEADVKFYWAEIRYQYTVSGQTFVNDRTKFGDKSCHVPRCENVEEVGTTSQFAVQETLKRYPVNKTITVYFEPDNPQNAVLEREFPITAYVYMLAGIGLLAFAVIVAASQS